MQHFDGQEGFCEKSSIDSRDFSSSIVDRKLKLCVSESGSRVRCPVRLFKAAVSLSRNEISGSLGLGDIVAGR